MPSFTITGTTTTQQTLASDETGFVSVLGAISTAGTAIDGAGSIRLTILGAVQAFGGFAVDHDGTDLVMDIGANGYVGSSSSDAVSALVTSSALVTNYGVVQSDSDGLDLRETDGSALIRVVNHGHISGRSDGLVLSSGSGTTTIINTGTIDAQSYGIFNAFAGQSGVTFLDNSGVIQGLTLAYGGDGSTEIIRNSGTMIGGIDLDDGNDRYQGTGGVIVGLVTGENGDDTLVGGAFADNFDGGNDNDLLIGQGGDDTLAGSSGNDRMLGGSGDDEMSGGDDNDTLNGQSGDDTLDGGLGNDLLLGQVGVDFLVGAAGNDTLDGGEGDDQLFGGADSDVLRGRDGIDYIDGGLGRDVTEGGPGADLFIFNNVLDSTPDANRDVILDFEKGIDTINLVNVIPGVFVFRGTSAFTASGPAELRLLETPDGSTIVQMDTNGDGVSDMQIRTAGVIGLTAGDFDL